MDISSSFINYLIANIDMKLLISFLLFTTVLNAQVSSIELPEGEDEIKINRFTPLLSIYVDENNEVYLEKEPIRVFDLAKELSYLRYKMPFEVQMRIKVFLYVDNNSSYSVIDEIKSQLASAYFERLYYKTNSIEDKDILKGISWTNHQSFYHLKMPNKILTKKEQERNKRYNDSLGKLGGFDGIPPPPPPQPNWFFDSQYIIYSDSKAAIEEALEGKKYSCVTLTNVGFEKDNEIIKFDDKEKLETLFYSQDIVFVRFSENLKYSNYISAIKDYKNLEIKKRGYFFELSSEIEKIHEKSDIKLCN